MTKRSKSENVRWHGGEVSAESRQASYGQKGTCVWLTGLSGSGKSTVAYRTESELIARGRMAYVLDGDNLRHGLNGDLGFSPEDRQENIRRVGEVARLFVDAGVIVLASFVSPYRADRDSVRASLGEAEFVEVFVDTPLHVCESRDPKGLYRRARAGELQEFTGISAPYEPPEAPELRLQTGAETLDQCVARVCDHLAAHHRI